MPGITLSLNFSEEEIDDMIGPVCEMADLDCETVEDPLLRDLINAAQKLRDREGFLVTDGSELDT